MSEMLPFVRVPAVRVQVGEAAKPWQENPAGALQRHFEMVARERMGGLDFLNPAVDVAVAGIERVAGDWLAALVTPWCIQFVLLPGGGSLWEDSAAGLRRRVTLPAGELVFLGEAGEAVLPAFQYCPLVAPLGDIADTEAAVAVARDALAAVLTSPGPSPVVESTSAEYSENRPSLSRRAFLRGRDA